ncbi:conjugal transfer protein TraI, partial [Bradyrhizobium sp. Arg68]|uniref:LPD7 domain-containing protein n=1 Tax=Bradyrhizobium ivorense TaxID=2511166 RepID=UPI0027E39A90
KPTQPHPASAALFAEYQRERQASVVKRREGLEQIKRENATYRAQLHQWKQNERMVLKVGGKGATRKIMAETIRQQAEAGKAEQRKAANERRERLVAATTMPTWADWLAHKAEQGNLDALAILRSREEREQRMRGDLLTAERADKAKAVVLDALKPQARKDGSMAYRTIDGGMVIDRKSHVQAAKATAGAALVALSLAEKRFEGQTLIVEGSEQFRREVAQLAGMHGFKVRFADAAMEQARQSAESAKAAAPKGQGTPPPAAQPTADSTRTQSAAAPAPKAPESGPAAVERWIARRNATRDTVSSIDYTRMRLWQPGDAGAAVYQGRRRMEDGSEVLLLKRGDEMLVKPSSQRVVAMASKWKVGRSVELDARGRFIDKSNAVER